MLRQLRQEKVESRFILGFFQVFPKFVKNENRYIN